jgi:hypothetical protein
MKQFLWIFFFSFSPIILLAQAPWSSSGAVRYYSEGSITTMGYIIVEKINDTIIQTKLCDNYTAHAYYYDYMNMIYDDQSVNTTFTYIENNKVFALSGITNSFYKLYDFDAQVGDIWYIHGTAPSNIFSCLEDSSWIQVDSIDINVINNDSLKVFYISQAPNASWTLGEYYVEKIGGSSYLFPQPQGCLAEVPLGIEFRCYNDNSNWNYMVPGTISCSFINSIEDNNSITKQLTPNPTKGEIFISGFNDNFNIVIKDLTGRLNYTGSLDGDQVLNISFLTPGLYIVLISNEKSFFLTKLIKF